MGGHLKKIGGHRNLEISLPISTSKFYLFFKIENVQNSAKIRNITKNISCAGKILRIWLIKDIVVKRSILFSVKFFAKNNFTFFWKKKLFAFTFDFANQVQLLSYGFKIGLKITFPLYEPLGICHFLKFKVLRDENKKVSNV